MPPEVLDLLSVQSVTAGALLLCHDDAPTRYILCAGAGGYASARMFETEGIFIVEAERNPEGILAQWDIVSDTSEQRELESAAKQTERFLMVAMAHMQAEK